MRSYIFIYRSGPDPIPSDRVQENRQAWRIWSTNLHEQYGLKGSTGKVVSSDGIADYSGNFRGASMVEAESLDAAVEIAKKSPNIPYGGSVDVIEEYQR
ncbi:MAG: YciI family protein [Candidatus Saccharimonadales bacterium]